MTEMNDVNSTSAGDVDMNNLKLSSSPPRRHTDAMDHVSSPPRSSPQPTEPSIPNPNSAIVRKKLTKEEREAEKLRKDAEKAERAAERARIVCFLPRSFRKYQQICAIYRLRRESWRKKEN